MRLKFSSSPDVASKANTKLLLEFNASSEGESVKLCCVQDPATEEDSMVAEASVSFVISDTRLAVKLPEYAPRE